MGGNARAETIISTLGAWNGYGGIGPWGSGPVVSVGQTFTAPNYFSQLTSMSFYMALAWGDPQNYKFYVYNWGGTSPTGSPLFSSNQLTAPSITASPFPKVTINTGNTVLVPNTQYVGIFSTLGLANPIGFYDFGYVGADAHAGGNIVYSTDNSIDSGWTNAQAPNDLAFEATAISN